MAEQDDNGADQSIDIAREIVEANGRLAIDLSQTTMPLDITIRATALTIAQRHCGDTCVKEGAFYNALKMDSKLGDAISVNHVLHAALIFERFLWGEWSKGLAGKAMESALDELDEAVKNHVPEDEDPPIRPSSGGEKP